MRPQSYSDKILAFIFTKSLQISSFVVNFAAKLVTKYGFTTFICDRIPQFNTI